MGESRRGLLRGEFGARRPGAVLLDLSPRGLKVQTFWVGIGALERQAGVRADMTDVYRKSLGQLQPGAYGRAMSCAAGRAGELRVRNGR